MNDPYEPDVHQAQSTHYKRPRFWGKVEILTPDGKEVYLRRWYLARIPRLFSIRLHHILLPDTDRHPHDHPWPFLSIILWGGYNELWSRAHSMWRGQWSCRFRCVRRFSFHRSTDLHQIQQFHNGSTWSLFITGPEGRVWGFETPDGWMNFRDYEQYAGIVP